MISPSASNPNHWQMLLHNALCASEAARARKMARIAPVRPETATRQIVRTIGADWIDTSTVASKAGQSEEFVKKVLNDLAMNKWAAKRTIGDICQFRRRS